MQFRMSDDPAPIWDADLEVCLFESMQGHKPVGFNKHFHMMCIQHKYEDFIGYYIFPDFTDQHVYYK